MEQTRSERVEAIQRSLADAGLDGWLFYGFHQVDPLALRILQLDPHLIQSRRWFYFVPAKGLPRKLVHKIESQNLDVLPGEKIAYAGWRELERGLEQILQGVRDVAMQYSPDNAIPYVSRVDAGTVELVKKFGVRVVSSADLVQQFEATWSEDQLQDHLETANVLRSLVDRAFGEIRRRLEAGGPFTEYDLQQFLHEQYAAHGLEADYPPIVAVNEHSGNPHYEPTKERSAPIRSGDFVLLDIWAKKKGKESAVYADITWTGFVEAQVPEKYRKVFEIVKGARDAAVAFVQKNVAQGRVFHGWEVDDVARNYIRERGYGDAFIHRTGHSIGREVHGNGAHIDNFETRDERRILPRTCFSIEPGIYLPEFGVRSEIDVYVGEKEVRVTGQPIQQEVVAILR